MPLAKIATATVIAAVLAAIANVLLGVVAIAVLDIPDAFEPLETRAVISSTAGAIAVAGIVYAILTRLANDPDRTFRIVAAAVALVLSLYAPIALGLEDPPENPGTDAGSIGTLILMHVISAAVVVVMLTGRGGDGPDGGRRRRDPGRDPA